MNWILIVNGAIWSGALIILFWKFRIRLLMAIRASFVKSIDFSGDYADILKRRREWAKNNDIIILSIDHVRKKNRKGKEKDLYLKVYYVEDNPIMKWLGFRKGFVHQALKYH